jgi:hypothetical protein
LEIAPDEEANFAAKLEKINGQLRRLESIDQSAFSRPLSDDWRDEMQSMNRRLDRLQVPPLESLDATEGE